MRRLITAKIHHTDDTPWVNAKVLFKRVKDSYTLDTQYPVDIVHGFTDSVGNLRSTLTQSGVYLWVNESGNNVSKYECYLPGSEPFEFSLPFGDGLEVELGVLRAGSEPLETYPNTVINYIDDRLTSVQLGSTQIYSNEIVANANLSALRVINLNKGVYASSDNLLDVYAPLGLTKNSAAIGETFKALIFGELFDTNWGWADTPLYLGVDGNLTQTLTGNELFILPVAKVINPSVISIEFKDAIILN